MRTSWPQIPTCWTSTPRPAAASDFDVAVIYAGQGVALLRSETTAAEVVAGFVADV